MIGISLIIFSIILIAVATINATIKQEKEHKKKIDEHYKLFPDTILPLQKSYKPVSKNDYKEIFEREGILEKWDYFEKQLKPEIRFKLSRTAEKDIRFGQSKIGGRPDLPEKILWPQQMNGKYLAFLAQINFTELSHEELDFPKEGILYFFYSEDQDLYSSDDSDNFKLIFIRNPNSLLRIESPPTFTVLKDGIFEPCTLKFTNSYSLPNWQHEFVTKQFENMKEFPYELFSVFEQPNTKLGGHADNIQGTMEFECEMRSRGYSWNNIPVEELESIMHSQYNWKLLFQLDSHIESEMMWGDGGKLYFWIRESDFNDYQFDKTRLIIQYH